MFLHYFKKLDSHRKLFLTKIEIISKREKKSEYLNLNNDIIDFFI